MSDHQSKQEHDRGELLRTIVAFHVPGNVRDNSGVVLKSLAPRS